MLEVIKKDKATFDAQQGAAPQGRCVGGWAGLSRLSLHCPALQHTASSATTLPCFTRKVVAAPCPDTTVGWAMGTPGQKIFLPLEIWHQVKQFKSSWAPYISFQTTRCLVVEPITYIKWWLMKWRLSRWFEKLHKSIISENAPLSNMKLEHCIACRVSETTSMMAISVSDICENTKVRQRNSYL